MRKHLFLTLLVVMLLRSLLEVLSIPGTSIGETGSQKCFYRLPMELDIKLIAWYCFYRTLFIGWVWFIAMWIIVKSTIEMPSSKKLLWICLGDIVFNYGAFCLLWMIVGPLTSELHIVILVNQFLFSLVFTALFLWRSRKPEDFQEHLSE